MHHINQQNNHAGNILQKSYIVTTKTRRNQSMEGVKPQRKCKSQLRT